MFEIEYEDIKDQHANYDVFTKEMIHLLVSEYAPSENWKRIDLKILNKDCTFFIHTE